MTLDNDGVGSDNFFGCLHVETVNGRKLIHGSYMPDIFLQLV